MRDARQRLRTRRMAMAAIGAMAGVCPVALSLPSAAAAIPPPAGQAAPAAAGAQTGAPAAVLAGSPSATQLATAGKRAASLPALGPLRQADLLVVAPATLPPDVLARIRALPGVVSADPLDAARIKVNGVYVAMLGIRPASFRQYAAKPTAQSTVLWQNVADGGIAVSYLMGRQQKLPLGGSVTVAGATTERVPVAGFGTTGISGVDAVVSDAVARSLGIPAGNAVVISAPRARLSRLITAVSSRLPKGAQVVPLVAQAAEPGVAASPGSAGAISIPAGAGPGLSAVQTRAFLAAALSRVGRAYVWGGDGPDVFDCSGLVQWSLRQAGIVMPRVAADQARTGPRVSLSALEPGDLLFYHTDPTAPQYISHVAIYLGNGEMLQAPEPGEDVQVVPADFGSEFAGAVAIYPRVAAAVAGYPGG